MIDNEFFKTMAPISLEDMNSVRLMNRVDSKYVAHISKIRQLLTLLTEDFFIQEIDGHFNMPYSTCYFDTHEADMFYQHHRGKKPRQKIRTRIYEGSIEIPFLEIKAKDNKGRTKKKRVAMEQGALMENYLDFLGKHSDYAEQELVPRMENHFYRITLVNKEKTERVTIDTNLDFHNLKTGRKASLHDIGIIEWKRDGNSMKSKLGFYLRELRIKPSGFSKYCIGMALTDSNLRQNRLKPKIRMIEKIAREDFC